MRHPRVGVRSYLVLACALVVLGGVNVIPRESEPEEWRSYAGSNTSAKYSPLAQINKENVKSLKIAWRQSAMPMEVREGRSTVALPIEFQTTPLMADNLLFMKASDGSMVALNPGTGATVWSYVPPDLLPADAGPSKEPPTVVVAGKSSSRGLSYWTDGKQSRVITTVGSSLLVLDAKTGAVIPSFGAKGSVDLREGLRGATSVRWNAAPLIVRDLIVLGGTATGGDGDAVPGDIRAYDVRTGRLAWKFNVIPAPGEFGEETWLEGSNKQSGHGGTWTFMSADDELGYVYVTTEEPTALGGGDYYGAGRPGANLFADSLICLDARTGKRIWHFQAIHHAIWDYDFPAAPNLVDITVDGRKIKAIAAVSKQAFVYVLDRVTGEPVWPIEERPVPKGNVPGEWYSPTQPFPTKPPAFDQQGASIDDLIDFTPELRAEAIEILNQYTYAPGPFTPPSVPADGKKGTVQMPGAAGGANWTGAGLDPETGILYVTSAHTPFIAEMIRSDSLPPPANPSNRPRGSVPEWDTKKGAAVVGPWIIGPQGLPIFKPPYGRLVAIDLNKGEILWTVANGDGPRNHPAIKHLNLPKLGQPGRVSPLVTKTMVFLGEGGNGSTSSLPSYAGGKIFRAYDKADGSILWELELPGGTTGAPITYMYNGKQFIVVAMSFKGVGGELVALALP